MCEYKVLLTPMTIRIRINVSYKKARKTATILEEQISWHIEVPDESHFNDPL